MARKLLYIITVMFALLATYFSFVFAYSAKDVEKDISKAVTEYLIRKEPSFADATINIEYKYATKTFNGFSKRGGRIQYEVAELYPDFKPLGSVIIPIQVIVDDEPKEKVFLRTKVSVLKPVVVAKRSIKKKEVITDADVQLTNRDISKVYDKIFYKSTAEVVGKEVKTYIPRDYVVISWMLKERSIIQKNSPVKIMAVVGSVEVSADGVALDDGIDGSQIKVRNEATGKVVSGKVISSTEVMVESL